ncbi:ribosomal protein S18-alanine N-acetyltransferase [Endozoicomonas sp.]|uniref:ribosomal protein S18-alanine N-acetyltransferase n=1 Tax=Endozoicomonas sp. TaxID=1892382 RepID=UPI002883A02C|nr:ribosomal protein S18-alanine N-acetyltransferase [Endozoicomonas sp.]
MTSTTLIFRTMHDTDLEQVNAVEQRSAEHPWRKAHFADSMKSGYLCELAEANGTPVGHSVMMAAAGEASILILTVDKKHQGKGIGRQLLQHMMLKASQSGCETILLEVRQSNHKAFNLYLHEGFSEIGIRSNYYPMGNNREDAIVMAMELYSDDFD